MATRDSERRGKLGAMALLVFAVCALVFTGGSFAYCPALPSFDLCRVVPTCDAVHIDRADNGGPAWSCRSRFGR